MRNYLFFLLIFNLLLVWFGCKDEINSPEGTHCDGNFPDLPDWNYQPISSPLPQDYEIFGLFFVENRKGFASTIDGVWKTDNDGESWQKVYDGPVTQMTNIVFSDPNHGFITGQFEQRACLLTTRDAGLNWDSIHFPTAHSIENISFADSLRGLAICYSLEGGFYLAKTSDGGKSWESISEVTNLYPSDIRLLENGIGVVPTAYGKVFFTEDFGESWKKIETGFHSIRTIQFLDSQTGFLSGNSGIYKTEDGGMTWDTISHYNTELMHFFSKDDGIAAPIVNWYWGDDTQLPCRAFISTHDGGVNWKESNSSKNTILDEPTYVNSNTIYGIPSGYNFRLVKIYR